MPLLLSATKESKQKSTGQALFWTLHCPHVSAHSCIYLCQDTGPPLLPAGRSPQLLSSQLRLLSCFVQYAHPLQRRDIDSVTVLPPCALSNELSFFCVCLWVEAHDFTERVWDLEDSLGCPSPPATLFAAWSLCCLLLGYLLQAALTLSFQDPPTSASQRRTGITDVRGILLYRFSGLEL